MISIVKFICLFLTANRISTHTRKKSFVYIWEFHLETSSPPPNACVDTHFQRINSSYLRRILIPLFFSIIEKFYVTRKKVNSFKTKLAVHLMETSSTRIHLTRLDIRYSRVYNWKISQISMQSILQNLWKSQRNWLLC